MLAIFIISEILNSCAWLLLKDSHPNIVSLVRIIIGLIPDRFKSWKIKLASFQLFQQEITNIINQIGKLFYKDNVIIETKLLERCFLTMVSISICCIMICMCSIFVEYLICSNILHSHMFITLLLIAQRLMTIDFNICRHQQYEEDRVEVIFVVWEEVQLNLILL